MGDWSACRIAAIEAQAKRGLRREAEVPDINQLGAIVYRLYLGFILAGYRPSADSGYVESGDD